MTDTTQHDPAPAGDSTAAGERVEIEGLGDVLGKNYPPAVKFEFPGIAHQLLVAGARTEQDRDYDNGELVFWADGRPKMILAIFGPVDGGEPGTWWVRGRRAERALKDALKAAGVSGIAAGDLVQVVRGEDDEVPPKKPGGKIAYANTYHVVVTPFGTGTPGA